MLVYKYSSVFFYIDFIFLYWVLTLQHKTLGWSTWILEAEIEPGCSNVGSMIAPGPPGSPSSVLLWAFVFQASVVMSPFSLILLFILSPVSFSLGLVWLKICQFYLFKKTSSVLLTLSNVILVFLCLILFLIVQFLIFLLLWVCCTQWWILLTVLLLLLVYAQQVFTEGRKV